LHARDGLRLAATTNVLRATNQCAGFSLSVCQLRHLLGNGTTCRPGD